MKKIKNISSTLIMLATLYIVYQMITIIITFLTNEDTLKIAKFDANIFILISAVAYIFYIGFSISVLFFGHRISKKEGSYEVTLLLLNIVTTFNTLTTLLLKFSNTHIPKYFLSITIFSILLTLSLSTTSKLLKRNRE